MKNETYTSPSGNRYEIFPQTYTRMAGGVLEDCDMYEIEYVEYEIYLDDRKVQFAFDKEGIARSVRHYEFPAADISSWID